MIEKETVCTPSNKKSAETKRQSLRIQKQNIEQIEPTQSKVLASSESTESKMKNIKASKVASKTAKRSQNATNAKRPKKGDRNYYNNFDFLFKRTAFRIMTQFFKNAFQPFFERVHGVKKNQVDCISIE